MNHKDGTTKIGTTKITKITKIIFVVFVVFVVRVFVVHCFCSLVGFAVVSNKYRSNHSRLWSITAR